MTEVAKQKNEGVKLDAGKAPFVQGCLHYFPKALEAVALVSRYGKEKYKVEYNDVNWKRVPDGLARYTDALGRHMSYEAVDGFYDPESHLLHAAHAAWNALARLELLLKNKELDDRLKPLAAGHWVEVPKLRPGVPFMYEPIK